MTAFVPLIVLILLALAERVVYVRYLQERFQITFVDAPARSLIYFSLWSALVAALYPSEIAVLFSGVGVLGIMASLVVLFVVYPGVFRVLRAQLGAPQWLTALFPNQGLLTLEERYIVAKVGDVVSQQLTAGIMIVLLASSGVSYPMIVFSFVALFGVSHFYLFVTSGFVWGMYYTALAVAGAFAIPFFVVFVSGGIMWAILFHMLFYIFAGVFFAKLPRPSRFVSRDILCHDPKER